MVYRMYLCSRGSVLRKAPGGALSMGTSSFAITKSTCVSAVWSMENSNLCGRSALHRFRALQQAGNHPGRLCRRSARGLSLRLRPLPGSPAARVPGHIEVNSACDMACPLCFAEAAPGFQLTLEEVEDILDHYVAAESKPRVGSGTWHPFGSFVFIAR